MGSSKWQHLLHSNYYPWTSQEQYKCSKTAPTLTMNEAVLKLGSGFLIFISFPACPIRMYLLPFFWHAPLLQWLQKHVRAWIVLLFWTTAGHVPYDSMDKAHHLVKVFRLKHTLIFVKVSVFPMHHLKLFVSLMDYFKNPFAHIKTTQHIFYYFVFGSHLFT